MIRFKRKTTKQYRHGQNRMILLNLSSSLRFLGIFISVSMQFRFHEIVVSRCIQILYTETDT